MILVQQKIQREEYISIAPDDPNIASEDRYWALTLDITGHLNDSYLCDDWCSDMPGCDAVRPARYIRLFPAMFIYDDPFAQYHQLPIPDSAYEYVGSTTEKPDTGLHDNAITEVTDAWFDKQGHRGNIQGQT